MVYFDWRGGVHPCFPIWMDFKWCFTQADAPKKECAALLEDYKACLHKKDHVSANQNLGEGACARKSAARARWGVQRLPTVLPRPHSALPGPDTSHPPPLPHLLSRLSGALHRLVRASCSSIGVSSSSLTTLV